MRKRPKRRSHSSPFRLSVQRKSHPSQRTASWWDAVHSLSLKKRRSRRRTNLRRILGKSGKEKGRETERGTESGRGGFTKQMKCECWIRRAIDDAMFWPRTIFTHIRLATVSVCLGLCLLHCTVSVSCRVNTCHCVSGPWWTHDQIAHAWWWLAPAGELKEEAPGWESVCLEICGFFFFF